MTWTLLFAKRVRKQLERFPVADQKRILAALQSMTEDPLGGDTARLKGQPAAWRRRVGSFRIFFDLYPEQRSIEVVDVRRRTSTTY